MASKKKKTNKQLESQQINPAMIAVLVFAGFFVGTLSARIDSLNNGGGTSNSAGNSFADKQIAKIVSELESDIDEEAFFECYSNKETTDEVQEDEKSGRATGIRGTPGTILVDTETNKAVIFGGAVPVATIKNYVDHIIDGSEITATNKGSFGEFEEGVNFTEVSNSDHVRGSRDARLVMIEYSDYECPYCATFHKTAQSIVNDYKGDVAWAFRHFPLDNIHKNARTYAIAAECAARAGNNDTFWEITDAVYEL